MQFFRFGTEAKNEKPALLAWVGSLILEVGVLALARHQAAPSNLVIYEAALYIINSLLFFAILRAFYKTSVTVLVFIFFLELTFFGYLWLSSAVPSL